MYVLKADFYRWRFPRKL